MGTFTPITSKPTKSDPYIYLYNNSENGGKSSCVTGKPADSECNVLWNCVGWACGRFNHIYNLINNYNGIRYPAFCCNAEKFIEVAKQYGLSVGTDPKPGAIMCWQKGATLNSSDGAGHVAVVEKVISNNEVITSESGYNSFVFKTYTRYRGTGNWTSNESYHFRGFVYNPAVDGNTCESQKSSENSNSTSDTKIEYIVHSFSSRDYNSNQIRVTTNNLRVRSRPSLRGKMIGIAEPGYYTYTATRKANKLVWYKIDSNKWIAYSNEWAELCLALDKKSNEIQEGCLVKLMSDATIYGTNIKFSDWVYRVSLYVREISGDRVTVSIYMSGEITGAVSKNKLIKVK